MITHQKFVKELKKHTIYLKNWNDLAIKLKYRCMYCGPIQCNLLTIGKTLKNLYTALIYFEFFLSQNFGNISDHRPITHLVQDFRPIYVF